MSKKILEFSEIKNIAELLTELSREGYSNEEKRFYLSQYQDYKARLKGIPLSGSFELTPFCNLDCKMCYVHLYKDQLRGSKLLSVEQWKRIMKEAHEKGMMKACLTGGECLIYPGFEELYLYLESMGIQASVKTNGLLLDQKLHFFEKHPPKAITVSLYGSNEDAYEKVTGVRAFQKVIENLQLLENIKCRKLISITPSKFMYEDAQPLLALAESLGMEYHLNYGLFSPRENTERDNYDLTPKEYVELRKIYHKLKNIETEPIDDIELPDPASSGNKRFGLQCGAGRSGFSVQWNGLMCACTNLSDISADLMKLSFADAWKQINRQAETIPLPEECPECPYNKVCMPCLAYHNDYGKPGHCNPAICEKTRAYVKAGLDKL